VLCLPLTADVHPLGNTSAHERHSISRQAIASSSSRSTICSGVRSA